MTKTLHQSLLDRVTRLPTDYRDYGGDVERWADPELHYADCSSGCRHFLNLRGKLGSDWGVCGKTDGPRFSLLTFEHQAGFGCFDFDENAEDGLPQDGWTIVTTGKP